MARTPFRLVYASLLLTMASWATVQADTLRFELQATGVGTAAGGPAGIVPIAETDTLEVARGDLVRIDVFISGWSPNEELLKAWQLSIDSTTFEDAASGEWGLEPWGYNGDQLAREEGAFIESTRSDYVYLGLAELPAVDVSTDIYRYGSTAINTSQFPCVSDDCNADPCGPFPQLQCKDDLDRYYVATLILKVLDGSCGTFNLEFLLSNMQAIDEFSRRICDQNGNASYEEGEINLVGMTLRLSSDCPCELSGVSTPPNCWIDARQPSDPDGSNPAGINQIVLETAPGSACNLTTKSFTLSEQPNPNMLQRNRITDVSVDGNEISLTLQKNLRLGAWTCVTLLGVGGGTVCVGAQPGDVSNNGETRASDVMDMLDCLTSGTCTPNQCDSDRSGTCAAPDIARLIDLLEGGATYDMWRGSDIGNTPACPSAP